MITYNQDNKINISDIKYQNQRIFAVMYQNKQIWPNYITNIELETGTKALESEWQDDELTLIIKQTDQTLDSSKGSYVWSPTYRTLFITKPEG